MRKVFQYLFCRWTRWTVYKADVSYIQPLYNFSPALGGKEIAQDRVLVDIYHRENKYNGLKQYKRVIKYQ